MQPLRLERPLDIFCLKAVPYKMVRTLAGEAALSELLVSLYRMGHSNIESPVGISCSAEKVRDVHTP